MNKDEYRTKDEMEDLKFIKDLKRRSFSCWRRRWRMRPEGAAHNPIATVKFDLNGEKKIMLNYAKLRIIDSSAG